MKEHEEKVKKNIILIIESRKNICYSNNDKTSEKDGIIGNRKRVPCMLK